ncbi:MAG: class I SAM-dependent methyltransferase, partial [Acidobacteriota bacterium]
VANFNMLSVTYDKLRFLQLAASRIAGLAKPPEGARVLDAATGTGEVVVAVGRMVGMTGSVVGIDIAGDMIARAREKVEKLSLHNIELYEGDAEHLDFPDQRFDCVICASGLFFFSDMTAALKEFKRVLVPGGMVAFSSFGDTFLQPLRSMWEARLRHYGLMPAWLPTHRISNEEKCAAVLDDAGFTQIDVKTEQLGYYMRSAEERWEDIAAGLEGKPLQELDPAHREQIRQEHIDELAALATDLGIWVDVPAIFAFGRRPAAAL